MAARTQPAWAYQRESGVAHHAVVPRLVPVPRPSGIRDCRASHQWFRRESSAGKRARSRPSGRRVDGRQGGAVHTRLLRGCGVCRAHGRHGERTCRHARRPEAGDDLVWNTRFSPDGRWIVYQVPGQNGGIYVQPFPGPGLRKQIASVGEYPVWRRDGKEIVYLAEYRVWSVRVDTSDGAFRAAAPEPLFSVRPSANRAGDCVTARGLARRLAHLFPARC